MRFLTLLAQDGAGTLLGPNDTADAFAQNLPPVSSAVPITFLLLTLAALLLPIDIAARRLSSLESLLIGLRWLLARLHLQHGEATQSAIVPSTADTPLSTLRARRQARRGRVITITPRKDAVDAKARDKTQTTQPKAQPAQPDVSIAEKLLQAKRKRTQGSTQE
jgi:hypothetical protein